MIYKKTWVKLSDSSQAQWLNVFHLYGGFNRKVTTAGFRIKGSVRIIQPIMDPYKGFTVKRINKGVVQDALIIRHNYNFTNPAGFVFNTKQNVSVLLKNNNEVLSKHILGPIFTSVRSKKFLNLFKHII